MAEKENWRDKDIAERLKIAADFTRPNRVEVAPTLLDDAREEIEQLRECVRKSIIFVDDVMPQIGSICLQDYANLNELCILQTQLIKKESS